MEKIDKIEDENDKNFAFAMVGWKSAGLISIGMEIFNSGDGEIPTKFLDDNDIKGIQAVLAYTDRVDKKTSWRDFCSSRAEGLEKTGLEQDELGLSRDDWNGCTNTNKYVSIMDGAELDRKKNEAYDVRGELKKQILVDENKKLSEEWAKINKYTDELKNGVGSVSEASRMLYEANGKDYVQHLLRETWQFESNDEINRLWSIQVKERSDEIMKKYEDSDGKIERKDSLRLYQDNYGTFYLNDILKKMDEKEKAYKEYKKAVQTGEFLVRSAMERGEN